MSDKDDVFEGLDPDESARLRKAHELLVEAGPPPELTHRLATLDPLAVTPSRRASMRRRRTFSAAVAFAAALAAAAFGAGYLTGHHHTSSATVARVASLAGTKSIATLRVDTPDAAGNWPIHLKVSGLPVKKNARAYYEVFVEINGKPEYPCGGFRMTGGTTQVHFSVPYSVTASTRWVVTVIDKKNPWPGHTVMTMA